MSKHILFREQYIGLVLLVFAICYGVLYGIGLFPEIGLYIAFATIIIGLLIFLVPLLSGPMKKAYLQKQGHVIHDFFERAGLSEEEMRLLIEYTKLGYKLGFSQPNTPPYIAVMLTTEKFSVTDTPKEDDYSPWKEAIEKIDAKETTILCPICKQHVLEACENCGWKPN
jgi:hypothetical protein